MRVVLSLLTLDPEIAGGSERYVRGLCGALAGVGEHAYVAVVPSNAAGVAGALPSVVADGVPVGRGPARRVRTFTGLRFRPRSLADALADGEVVHYPVTVPLPPTDRPTVVTLHDLQHLDQPESFSIAKRRFRRRSYDDAARDADHVITISSWVRDRAISLLGLAPDRVHVAHHGIEEHWFEPPTVNVEREPFLVYPARGWAHKNHLRLFEALSLLRVRRPGLRLVLTGGGHDWKTLPDGVESLGRVDDIALRSLYRRASALVFPSLYEGFGLPVLEAMAAGCPVAASTAGAIPEIAGDGAVLFDPTDVGAMVEAVEEALALPTARLVEATAHARTFSWEASARVHDRVYGLAIPR